MGKIYAGQSKLRIQLTCSQDVTDAACYIQYKKPDGTTGIWDAVIGTAATGVIYYDVPDTLITNYLGVWKVWAKVIFSDSKIAYGEAVEMLISNPGE